MMLDITKEDIEKLNDTDLRILIGKLCEAEIYSIGDNTCCVSYGGEQDEKDGGIDVKITATKIIEYTNFIPNNNTIFQVKKTAMPANKIKKEMMNYNGDIKNCIKEIDELHGSYVIVSSGDDLTELTYDNRINKMKDILKANKIENVAVEFYDCNKIATWVRKYPSLVCWVNDKNHCNTNGWVSYMNWSDRKFQESNYIIDDNCVIFRNDFSEDNKIYLIDGINEIRKILSVEKAAIRLAGLSGVGKTRFAQALFDESIGNDPLNKEFVIYGDVSDNLVPDPITFIQQLENLDRSIILIVDNCEANMHNKLTEICQRMDSKISLMTIEYDVKEDDNVDSTNYYLGTTSKKVLKQLIKRDYKEISDINVDTIVNCSDGNFRIAIYLAKSIFLQKNIGILKSEDLFNRLFYQGGSIDNELLTVGEVCSIFYSFNIEYDLSNEKNELNIISKIISKEPITIFKYVEELRLRQIVQKRGNMRAVLPHALANKLAIDFLKKHPSEYIVDLISNNSRLFLSFFRRLKFLHLSEEAKNISEKYFNGLTDQQLIESNVDLIEIVKCITILNPELVLQRLEKITEENFFSRDNSKFYEWVRILNYIAYDEDLFKRTTKLIVKYALTENVGENYNSIRKVLYNMFHSFLSFTMAPLKTRLETIDDLLNDDPFSAQLALKLISEVLEYGQFVGNPLFDCGSQIRDYGLYPNINEWYVEALNYCKTLISENIYCEDIKNIIANSFRNLASIGFYNELEELVEKELSKNSWPQIWISLHSIKKFDYKKVPHKLMEKIDALIKKVEPITISDRIKVFLNKGRKVYLYLEDVSENEKKLDEMVYSLGKDIALEINNFTDNIVLIDNSCNMYRISYFADGLYDYYNDKELLIETLLNNINEDNEIIIKEIVSELINKYNRDKPKLCANIVDKIFNDDRQKKYYTYLQFSYILTKQDIARLNKALKLNMISDKELHHMEWCLQKIDTETIIAFFDKLPKTKTIKNKILFSLYRIDKERKNDANLKKYIRKYILELNFEEIDDNHNSSENYIISSLVESSFFETIGLEEAKEVFKKINLLIDTKYISFYPLKQILKPLIKLYPCSFLNIFIGFTGKPSWNRRDFFGRCYDLNSNVLFYIEDDVIIDWLKKTEKIEEISYVIEPYVFDKEKASYTWSKLGRYIIDNFYDNKIVMENVFLQIYPHFWSDEYSNVLKRRKNLFEELINDDNPIVSNFGKIKLDKIKNEISICLLNEQKEKEEKFNTFE